MNITKVQVHVLYKPGSLKALADVILDDDFKVVGFQIREDSNGCTFVTMPFRERDFILGNGQSENRRINVAHPLNKPTQIYLETKIIDEYERVLNLIASKRTTTPCSSKP
jgi:DNA-binding cell septation regulator SpoVG